MKAKDLKIGQEYAEGGTLLADDYVRKVRLLAIGVSQYGSPKGVIVLRLSGCLKGHTEWTTYQDIRMTWKNWEAHLVKEITRKAFRFQVTDGQESAGVKFSVLSSVIDYFRKEAA